MRFRKMKSKEKFKHGHGLTPSSSPQGGLPLNISMTVQPKLHMSTARARFGSESFFMTAFMTCSGNNRSKKKKEKK